MVYADFDFYVGQYHGNMPGEAFLRISRQASAYIDQITFDRIRTGWAEGPYAEKIRMACCAVADAYYLNEQGGGVVSETVGKMTRNYAAGVSNTPTEGQHLHSAAALYLVNTGLMCRAVD